MTDLIDSLPLSALVTVHNSLTANTVKKFENRTKAKRRIGDVLKNHGGMTFVEAAKAAGLIPHTPFFIDGDQTFHGMTVREVDAIHAEPDEQDAPREEFPDNGPSDPHETSGPNSDADDDAAIARRAALDAPIAANDAPIAEGSLMRVLLTTGEIAALAQVVFAGPPSLCEAMATNLLEKLRTATPATPTKAPRAARATTPNPREGGMTAAQRTITDLCQRPQGATGKELAEGCGWPSIAARTTCQKLADRFGFTLTENPKSEGRGISFHMKPEA